MWGICLDYTEEAMREGLCQKVIQYQINEDGKAIVILPKTVYKPDIQTIQELPVPAPKYNYEEVVSPCNHPDMTGIIFRIGWHFKLNRYFYTIQVNGKVKSKRYYENDLRPVK